MQAAGSTAQLTGVCYACSARRQVSFASVHQRRRRRARLDSPIQTHVFEAARNDAGVANESNHLQLAATIGTPAQINSEYPLQSRHPTHWRSAHIGRGAIGAARFARELGPCHDARYEIGTCESSPSVSTLKDISLLIPIHYRLSDFLRRHQGGEVGVCAGYNWKHRGVANPQALNTPDAAGRVGD